MKQYLEIGKINNTHGIKGEMKLALWCDNIDYLKQFKMLYLDDKGNRPIELVSVRPQKDIAIIRLSGVDSIERAEELKGKVLYCNRDDATRNDAKIYVGID